MTRIEGENVRVMILFNNIYFEVGDIYLPTTVF